MSQYDPTDLEGQAIAEAERQSRDERARVIRESDIAWLMSGPKGRRIVWGLLGDAGVFHDPFSTNAIQMAHACGRKSWGLKILAMVQASENWLLMIQENQDE